MSLVRSMMVRVKADPLNPVNQMQMMKRLDEVKIHYDWLLTHNLNWALALSDHWDFYDGPLVKLKYEGALLPFIGHPDQRIACPRANGYRWLALKQLERGSEVFFVKANVAQKDAFLKVRITEYDLIWVAKEPLFTITTMGELSFIAHDLICHRNPAGYKADRTNKHLNTLVNSV